MIKDLKDLDGEIWKTIIGYSDYQISSLGRVKSFKNNCGISEKILSPHKNNDGYLNVILSKNGEKKSKFIHILMVESFLSKIPYGFVVHHRDFTKNDFLENFQVMTIGEHSSIHHKGKHPSEESKRKNRDSHLGKYCGENNPNSTLTEQNVIQIKSFWDNNVKISNILLGKLFGVRPYVVSSIKTKRTWKHIK